MSKLKNTMKYNKKRDIVITIILISFWASVFIANYDQIEYYYDKVILACLRPNVIEASALVADLYIKQTYGDHYQMTSCKVVTTPPNVTWRRNFDYVIATFEDIDHIEDDIIIYADADVVVYDSRKGGWLK